jgi:sec-independent protein translocase protein TatB
MPSLPDTAVIILLGLLLFGPKGLAQIARQLGKLMGEFRRASNEFRMQMEEELRIAEQADRQKEIAKIQAAAPIAQELPSPPAGPIAEDQPHLPFAHAEAAASTPDTPPAGPLPIATSGDLSIMPPATGLPAPRSSSLSSLIDSVPKADPPGTASNHASDASEAILGEDQRPMRYTSQHAEDTLPHNIPAEESIHG